MNNKKLSSVEWLFEKLSNTPKDKFDWYIILEQAIAMHKEEIIKASKGGYWAASDGALYEDEPMDYGKTYYEQTFGGNNE